MCSKVPIQSRKKYKIIKKTVKRIRDLNRAEEVLKKSYNKEVFSKQIK